MSYMKRLWIAFLTSLLTVSASLAQTTSPPSPRPQVPDQQAPAAPSTQTAPAAPGTAQGPEVGPINPITGMPLSGPESVGETFETGSPRERRHIWGSVDYIFWTAKGDSPPALVTTAPSNGLTPLTGAGAIGSPGTQVLFGGTPLNDQGRSGVKFEFGCWLDSQRTFGIQAGAFFLATSSEGQTFASDGSVNLFRPTTQVTAGTTTNVGNAISFSTPLGVAISGAVDPREVTSVDGFDVAIRSLGCCGPCWRFDTLIGYRYLRLTDRLSIDELNTFGPQINTIVKAPPGGVAPPFAPGTLISTVDDFNTNNSFNGAEFGVTGEYRFWNHWTLDGTVKVSLGYLAEQSTISGGTNTLLNGVRNAQPFGLLTVPGGNIGTLSRTEGQLMPEINLNLTYEINDRVRLRAGYSFLYLNDVFRAGSSIDTFQNLSLFTNPPSPATPGSPTRPLPTDLRNEYILHGFNAGLEFRF
jgi:Putative beta barrel porin-7 (BBP7)